MFYGGLREEKQPKSDACVCVCVCARVLRSGCMVQLMKELDDFHEVWY
jgi:hypothetical protein